MYFIIYAVIGLVVYFFIIKAIVNFFKTKLKEDYIFTINKKYFVNIARIVLLSLPFYLIAMFYTALMQEGNLQRLPKDTADVNLSLACRKSTQVERIKRGMSHTSVLIGNGYDEFGNRWLLEITPILTTPISVLDNKDCLQVIMKKMTNYDGKAKYIIYTEEAGKEKAVFTIQKESN